MTMSDSVNESEGKPTEFSEELRVRAISDPKGSGLSQYRIVAAAAIEELQTRQRNLSEREAKGEKIDDEWEHLQADAEALALELGQIAERMQRQHGQGDG